MNDKIPVPYGALILWVPREVFDAALDRALGSRLVAAPAACLVGGNTAAQRWLTTEALAELTGLKPGHLRASARAGLLPHRKVGRRVLFPADAISSLASGATALTAVRKGM